MERLVDNILLVGSLEQSMEKKRIGYKDMEWEACLAGK